jgi:hypothetical protein
MNEILSLALHEWLIERQQIVKFSLRLRLVVSSENHTLRKRSQEIPDNLRIPRLFCVFIDLRGDQLKFYFFLALDLCDDWLVD